MRARRRNLVEANGFTLLEVMVALAIFSLAAMALMRLQAFSLRSGGDVIAHEMTWQVAKNRAAEILSDPTLLTLGETQGAVVNGGQEYLWTQQVKRTDDARLVRIDVKVTAPNGKQAILKMARPLAQ